MSEPVYIGRWYFTVASLKSINAKVDVVALQMELDDKPFLVDVISEQLDQVDSLLESGFELTTDTVRAVGIIGSFESPYASFQVEGGTELRFRTGKGDEGFLRWIDGSLFFHGNLPLTRTRPVLVRPLKPAPAPMPAVDAEVTQLVIETFFHRRAQQVLAVVAQAWTTGVTSAISEGDLDIDTAQKRRLAEGLKELCERVVATVAADFEKRIAEHVLAALGPERSAELAAMCQSDAIRGFRATLVAEQQALNQVYDQALSDLATSLQSQAQSVVEAIFEGD